MSGSFDFKAGRFTLTAFPPHRSNGQVMCNSFITLNIGDREKGVGVSGVMLPAECRELAAELLRAADHAEEKTPAAIAAE